VRPSRLANVRVRPLYRIREARCAADGASPGSICSGLLRWLHIDGRCRAVRCRLERTELSPPVAQAARSEFLTGNASPTYPAGTPGQIAVVAQATLALPVPSGGETVPIVVRNNTAHTVTRIAAQGAVHDASRKPVATGSDQGLHPAVLQPGQVALGFIYLGPGSSVPTGSTMTVQVSARPSSSPTTDVADLVVMEVNDTGHQSRDSQEHAGSFDPGSYSVDVFCLAASGAPSAEFGAFADSNEDLAAGASSGFTVDLYGAQCAQYLIGASGYDQGAVGN
jgi:hypothetical protein